MAGREQRYSRKQAALMEPERFPDKSEEDIKQVCKS
jgi:hypothetical protein